MVEQEEVKCNLLRNTVFFAAAERSEQNSTLGKIFAKSNGVTNRLITSEYLKESSRLTEAGIVDHLFYKDVRPSVFHCISSAGKTQKSLKILQVEDFIGMFALLLIGFTMAAFVFVLEFFI
ncbi:hypothetical protein Avbf_10679 [Armadillidium vulgare]|nr:hypothetical protein Avbf_10679 [Armadillidium vulgare]